MSGLEKFNLGTAIVGLAVDLITLVGFITGFVVPHPDWGFVGDPGVIGVVTITIIIYGVFTLLFFVIRSARKRWAMRNRKPSTTSREIAPLFLSYMLWVPSGTIWEFAMNTLFLRSYNLTKLDSDLSLKQMMFFMFVLPAVGFFLAKGTDAVVDYFEPVYSNSEY